MGGVVARLATRLDSELPVDAIMTVATPHQLPPANLEYGMEKIYSKLNDHSESQDPILISVCGGASDTQIISDTCALSPELMGPNDGFAVFSSGIPAAWTNVEHQAIVWCEQIRWRVARVLLDMNAASTRAGKLSSAKKWLRGSSTLSTLSSRPSRTNRTIPIVNAQMSLIVRLHHTTPREVANPPFTLSACDESKACHKITAQVRVVPYPEDTSLPFPLPGEGIRNGESAFVIDARDLPSGGTLRLESDVAFHVLSFGSHRQHVADVGKWSSESFEHNTN